MTLQNIDLLSGKMTTNWTLCESDMGHDAIYYLAFRYYSSNKDCDDTEILVCQRYHRIFLPKSAQNIWLFPLPVYGDPWNCTFFSADWETHSQTLAVVCKPFSYENMASLSVSALTFEMEARV